MDKGTIFPLFYLPPVQYFSELKHAKDTVLLERNEHFPKQTYRNRAVISSHNGKLDLIIPVIKGSKVHTPFKDVKISYDFNWQRQHWMSLQTCYRSAAYFEFYEDELASFYEEKTTFLFDYNEALLRLLLKFLKMHIQWTYTTGYQPPSAAVADLRGSIHPKTRSDFQAKPYFQLFADRNGFASNLSVIDLLFSQGPGSSAYL
ncbi:WbqC family protein [Hufsiella ginkgonis]|uniref:WbqC family protein n=1 Tax=Hufsiella ginkgonis TaxID=2695274 RepID=A0A7K1XY91_9SPHI|nr:WbqC family protein [Hufsiella ginkgonis]MXV15506.1 hypothetical protein [Hufsiella ginkgonis]